MPCYCVRPKGHAEGEAYWLLAESESEARRLIAINVGEAHDAEDMTKFECAESTEKHPPNGIIYRRIQGPIAIRKG
jgi:hypothetical protein